MNRYHLIKDEVNQILQNECYGKYRIVGYNHLYSVVATSRILANQRNLDLEIASIIAILHDLAIYKYANHFDHASRSSELARQLLQESNQFSEEELTIITTAIKNHSNKDKIDDDYSELIKDADLLVQYYDEPEATLPSTKQVRLNKILANI